MGNAPKRKSKDRAKPNAQPGVDRGPWPRRLLTGAGIAFALLLVGIVVLSPVVQRGAPEGTETLAVGAGQHVEGDVHSDDEVPAGGAHDAVWLNCGAYREPVRSENAVHSLEHGAVWITYRQGIPQDEVSRLQSFASSSEKVIVSPMEVQDSPILATAWAKQLALDIADDPRLMQFVVEFTGSANAPEPGGPCQGGIGTPNG